MALINFCKFFCYQDKDDKSKDPKICCRQNTDQLQYTLKDSKTHFQTTEKLCKAEIGASYISLFVSVEKKYIGTVDQCFMLN